MAASVFGTTDGLWETAANWSLGAVPTAATSAVVSSTSGICVLPAATSAVCSNFTGGGTLGIQAGGHPQKFVGKVAVAAPLRFVVVESIERTGATTVKLGGHG